ncbi:hypothetical protein Tco_0986082, partial [Tanacetum coccineum]
NMATTSKMDPRYEEKGKMIVAEPEITDVADLKTIDSNKTVEAIIYLQAHEISNHGFLEHYFNFAAYNELPRRANVKNVVLTVMLCITIQWLPTIRNLYDTLLPEPELPKTYHIKHQHEQLTDTTPFLNVNNQQYDDLEQEKLTNHFPLATILEVNPQNYQSFQAFKKISQEHPTPWVRAWNELCGNRIKDAHESYPFVSLVSDVAPAKLIVVGPIAYAPLYGNRK